MQKTHEDGRCGLSGAKGFLARKRALARRAFRREGRLAQVGRQESEAGLGGGEWARRLKSMASSWSKQAAHDVRA
eukprot:6178494-Pleurochrysis_carterae.AAC.1